MYSEALRAIASGSLCLRPDHFVWPRLLDAGEVPVTAEDALKLGRPTLILGDAGAGKTSLCRFLSCWSSEGFLGGRPGLPAAATVAATLLGECLRRCPGAPGAVEEAIHVAVGNTGSLVGMNSLRDCLHAGRLAILMDGMDELPGELRNHASDLVGDFASRYPQTRLLVTSRPTTGLPLAQGWIQLRLLGIDDSAVCAFSSHLLGSIAAQVFMTSLRASPGLLELALNPLMLSVMAALYRVSGRLPTRRAWLYNDLVDYLDETWEARKRLVIRSHLPLHSRHAILERVASSLFYSGRLAMSLDEFANLVTVELRAHGIGCSDPRRAASDMLSAGLIAEVGESAVGFVHAVWMEFYLVRGAIKDQDGLRALVASPDARRLLELACELMPDAGPLAEAALACGEVYLACRCLSHGRIEDVGLTSRVVQAFADDVGVGFVRCLASTLDVPEILLTRGQDVGNQSPYEDLQPLWHRCLAAGTSTVEKGRLLEQFARSLFGLFFRVASCNLSTESGEIDLVLEIAKLDPFWSEYGADVLVECKNRKQHTPLSQTQAFCQKIARSRGVRLGLLLSTSGFTRNALRELRNNACDQRRPLIVPLHGQDVTELLSGGQELEQWLKTRIREFKYLQVY